MRFLITTDTVGGVWTFTSELSRQWLSRGHAVHLVSFGRPPSPSQSAWCTEQQRADPGQFSTRFSTNPLEWMNENETCFEGGQAELLQDVSSFRPDLILSNQFCYGRLDTPVPRIVVAHSDVLSWARACRPAALEPSPWLHRYTALVQGGLLSASAVVAPTVWMSKALKASFFLPNNAVVIPNGVAVEPVDGPPSERRLEAITAGRLWDEAKGLDILGDLRSPMPILVAGDERFEAAGLPVPSSGQLRQLGPLSQQELHRQFRESAVYLCASHYEPFGLSPLEAALCGCAVVTRDLPSLREVWGESALFFHDKGSLESLLDRLAQDPGFLASAQHQAKARASTFSAERMADGYLQLMGALLHSRQVTSHGA